MVSGGLRGLTLRIGGRFLDISLRMYFSPVGECETLLMITSDFGIAAHLLYLKQLIHGYNSRNFGAHRVHLVWQLSDIGEFRTD